MKPTPLEAWVMRRAGLSVKDRRALEAYQLDKIRAALRTVKKNSRFYREQLAGVDPDAVRSFADFQRLPFTFPRQLGADPFGFVCVPQSGITRIVTLRSSGTSGQEKRIFFTEGDLALTIDFFRYGMSCLTDRTDRVLVLLPGNSYGSIGDLLQKALAKTGAACFVHGVVADPAETARCIVENEITCLVGIPIQVLHLSRAQSGAFGKIKKVLLSTDYVPETLVSELTRRFGCVVFTHYGMTEMGYGGGVECGALRGCHMREADLYFEIVDPRSGGAVEDGGTGEVVFTTLAREAMPLIRYRTGDIASFSAKRCPCGTFLKTLNRVQGRLENRVAIGERGFLSLSELDELLLSFREVADYRAYLTAENCLKVELIPESGESCERIRESAAGAVRALLAGKRLGGIGLRLEILREGGPAAAANSMTKRKICDLRAGGAAP